MSNPSLSASHQVSISHDPMEESQATPQGRFAQDGWPSGGRPVSRPASSGADLRPALLAGAIGLFAAWVIAGLRQSERTGRRSQRRRDVSGYVADREEGGTGRVRPQPSRDRADYTAGPQGRSSREDVLLDALNP